MTAPAALADGRRVPIASGFNLRDFGGYATADGRMVRRGMLYRSGTMSLLTEEDALYLRSLGIRAICDFRRPNERAAEPTVWHGEDVDYFCRDYSEVSGVLNESLADGRTPDDMTQIMIGFYREIAIDHAESYRAMFGQILAGRVPIIINCAAGKDRTGVGAALILEMLGVPRATIMEDYLLTNSHADWDWRLSLRESRLSRARAERPDVVDPMLMVAAPYLDAFFEVMDRDHSGVDGYLEDVLGIDPAAQAAIRDLLIEA